MRRSIYTVAVVLLLSGCSGSESGSTPTPPPYEKPAWMAAQAQADEELVESQSSCLTAAGYTFEADGTGMFQPSPGTDVSAFSAALRQCTSEALGDADGWSPSGDELRTLYQRQLEVAACLENEGYTVEDIPSEDAYVDSEGGWSPYDGVVVEGEEQMRMKKTCPDPGPASL